ncbi:MAG: hypothetical protein Q8O14_12250 [bacterium]|nr:hypothetical protein [bacterium]
MSAHPAPPRHLLAAALLMAMAAVARGGEYAADFVHLGTGADAAGMAGAWSTSKSGATSFFWNPALVLDGQPLKLYAEGVSLFDGLSTYQSAALQWRVRERWALCAGAQANLVTDIPRYAALAQGRDLSNPDDRSTGVADGSFDSRSTAVTVGLSREFWFDILMGRGLVRNRVPARLAVGSSLRMIRESLDAASASGSGVDVGVKLMMAEPVKAAAAGRRELVLAIVRHNLVSQDLAWDTPSGQADPLPAATRVGLSWQDELRRLHLGWRVAMEYDDLYDGTWHLGTELDLRQLLFLRGGVASPDFGEAAFSMGAGLRLRHALVNYAYGSHALGPSHRVSLEFRY